MSIFRYAFIVILFLGLSFSSCYTYKKFDFFSRVIIWGHPLHSHTHSYIHEAFYRAFDYLGYEVYWISSLKEIEHLDLADTLFLTEGQVDAEIPKRDDCYYILHNCSQNYQELVQKNRCIALQVYTHACLPYVTEKLGECIYSNRQEKMIFMPWAADLLPYEIDKIKSSLVDNKKESIVNWVGTVGGGIFGNSNEIDEFKRACNENNIEFKHMMNIETKEAADLVKFSYLAPAIQGAWQCENGYIPCRIFKNISYGQWGITNNKTVYDLFEGKIIYNADTYQLFYDAKLFIEKTSIQELYYQMDLVRDNHTYINRIDTLLAFMQQALDIKEK